MKLATTTLTIQTRGAGLVSITREVERWLLQEGAGDGQLTLFIRHTSASLTVQENADPDVLADLEDFMRRLAPWNVELYRHRAEGADDMPAHIRAALTNTSLTIPVVEGRMALGTWQAIYLWEHRQRPQTREIVAQLLAA